MHTSLESHILLYNNDTPNPALITVYITDIEVNDGRKSAFFKFAKVHIFEGLSLTETKHFVLE